MLSNFNAFSKVIFEKSFHYLNNIMTDSNVIRNKNESTNFDKVSIFFKNPDFIIDNIYLGNGYNAANYDLLKKKDIKLVINITEELSNYFTNEFDYLQIKILDNDNNFITPHLDIFFNKIDSFNKKKDGNILIHCYMGSSRSVSFVIAYLMKYHKKNYDEAYNFLNAKRENININIKFIHEIINYFDNINYNKDQKEKCNKFSKNKLENDKNIIKNI